MILQYLIDKTPENPFIKLPRILGLSSIFSLFIVGLILAMGLFFEVGFIFSIIVYWIIGIIIIHILIVSEEIFNFHRCAR